MAGKSKRVQAAMAKAVAVDDAPFDPSAVPGEKPRRASRGRSRKSDSPMPHQTGVDPEIDLTKLTAEQWQILRRCAAECDENDIGNANRLLAWYGSRVLNVLEAGWHGWTGTHWDFEAGQHMVERYAQQVSPLIKREAALIEADADELMAIDEAAKLKEMYPEPRRRPPLAEIERLVDGVPTLVEVAVAETIKRGSDIAKAVAGRRAGRFQFGIRSGDRARTRAMIDQAEPHRTARPADMDSDDYAINTPSGTIRLERAIDRDCPDPDVTRYKVTRRLDPHNPADLMTKITRAGYDPKATAPNFMRDLARFVPDVATQEFLQVFFGYCALGLNGEQVYCFFYGDGQNWKSALTHAVGKALGSYTKPMMYTSISGQNMPSGDKPSPDWARLPGVRMLTIEEVPGREPIREELIKMITSGSDMPVRHLNKGLFDMATKFTAVMISNAEPNIRGADMGIWRRTIIVRFQVIIPTAERRPINEVLAMYAAEDAGILNWIVAGAEKYLAQGLAPFITDDMRAFTEGVRRDRDAVGSFVADCIREREGWFVTSRSLYTAFKRWCSANGIDPIPTETSFGLKLKRVPVNGVPMENRKRNPGGVKRFVDIELHDVPEDESSPYSSSRDPEPP
jgi:putative DNA primase/helicase